MLIGITIGDSDFNRTIKSFLGLFNDDSEVMRQAEWCHHGAKLSECDGKCQVREPLTKERVIELWGYLSVGLYVLCQRGYMPHYKTTLDADVANVRSYLKLTARNVFFEAEVTDRLAEDERTGNGNYEFTWVDTLTGEITTR